MPKLIKNIDQGDKDRLIVPAVSGQNLSTGVIKFGETLQTTSGPLVEPFSGNAIDWFGVYTPYGAAHIWGDLIYMFEEGTNNVVWSHNTDSSRRGLLYDKTNDNIIVIGKDTKQYTGTYEATMVVLNASDGSLVRTHYPNSNFAYWTCSQNLSDENKFAMVKSAFGGSDYIMSLDVDGNVLWTNQGFGTDAAAVDTSPDGRHVTINEINEVLVYDKDGNNLNYFTVFDHAVNFSDNFRPFIANDNDYIYVPGKNGFKVYDYDGNIAWEPSLTLGLEVNPRVGPRGDVYVTSTSDGTTNFPNVYRLNPSTQTVVWNSAGILGDSSGLFINTAISDTDGKLFCWSGGTLQWAEQV